MAETLEKKNSSDNFWYIQHNYRNKERTNVSGNDYKSRNYKSNHKLPRKGLILFGFCLKVAQYRLHHREKIEAELEGCQIMLEVMNEIK
jgi:hypothetical protein